jgi:hypothetical protein
MNKVKTRNGARVMPGGGVNRKEQKTGKEKRNEAK